MDFILVDHLKWFKGNPDTLLDETGHTHAPYVYYSNLQHDGQPFKDSVDRYVSYPAFHHALAIEAFLAYRQYTGDQRALQKAIELADWNIQHSTPSDVPYGNLPYSTFYMGKPGGFQDSKAIMTDKPAIMALAYIRIFGATGSEKYFVAARKIADTLSRNQSVEGSWPFRVDPKTREVREQYTPAASSTRYSF